MQHITYNKKYTTINQHLPTKPYKTTTPLLTQSVKINRQDGGCEAAMRRVRVSRLSAVPTERQSDRATTRRDADAMTYGGYRR